jgi:1,4-dihydroxy-2-naphthoate octaprenyltransferase
MTEQLTSENLAADARRTAESRVRGLLRLSKIYVYQHYYGWAVAWVLASTLTVRGPNTTAAMLLFLVGSVGIVTCACSADDIVGFRNGSDAINYQAGERRR